MKDYGFILLAYLSGSIPYGLLLTYIFGGVDIRQIGSGNIGTTNVLRTGRKSLAAATLACDTLKGFLPVYGAAHFGIADTALYLVAFTAILGHVFPIWLKFKGGKGVATSLGVFAALSWPLGLFAALMWILVGRLTKISSLSALCSFTISPIFAVLVLSKELPLFTLVVTLLIFWTHRSNIQRLMKGRETEIGESGI